MNRLIASSLIAFLAVGASFSSTQADWPDDPNDNVALTQASGHQWLPALASDGSGGWIVVWRDERAGSKVFGQRLSSSGTVVWDPNGRDMTPDLSRFPQIASAEGGAFVTWAGSDLHAYVQRINGSGAGLWGTGVRVGGESSSQADPAIASDGDQGALVVWADLTGIGSRPYAQHLDVSGNISWQPGGVVLGPVTGDVLFPVIISDGGGGAIIAWQSSSGVHAQRVDVNGNLLWGSGGVTLELGFQFQHVGLIESAPGEPIVVYQAQRGGTGVDVIAHRLAGDGTRTWGSGVTMCNAVGNQNEIRIVPDGAGGVIAAWRDERVGTPEAHDLSDIYAQRVNASGAKLWGTNGVAVCEAAGFQTNPAPVADATGGVIIGWADARISLENQNLYAQRITSDGSPAWTSNGILVRSNANDVGWPSGLPTPDQGALFVWNDNRSGINDTYAQLVNHDGTLGDGVVPVQIALMSSDYRDGKVYLRWYAAARSRAELYKQSDDQPSVRIGSLQSNGLDQMSYVDTEVRAGSRYWYRLGVAENGVERHFGETSVEVPVAGYALHGASNPTSGRLEARFSLPDASSARIELLSVSGQRMVSRSVGHLGQGTHSLILDRDRQLAPGVYFLRLIGGTNVLSRKVLVVS